jgi:lipoprotein-anchoring transpeptidase ErfK/SrfK
VTGYPETVGSTVQIELQNPAGGGVTLLEGRVMHVVPTENGQYAMGIRLASRLLRPPAPTRVSGGGEGLRRASAAARRMEARAGAPGSDAGFIAQTATREAVTFRRVEDRGRSGSWAALVAIVALVLILVLLIFEAVKEQRKDASLRGPRASSTPERVAAVTTDMLKAQFGPVGPPRERAGGATLRAKHFDRGFIGRDIAFAMYETAGLSDGRAIELPADMQRATLGGIPHSAAAPRPVMTLGRFVDQLEYAADASDRDEPGLAMAVARRAIREAGEIPAVWKQYGEEFVESIQSRGDGTPAERLSEYLMVEPARSPGTPAAGQAMRVHIDTVEHVLRVWRGGTQLAEFPVGLGQDGTTPAGTYRIANKVTDPAWYPADGRVVPAGDPANPIGARWLGLSDGPRPTGIGIHPTRQASSIGRDASGGCVRMRPADAETLYRLVPVGSPVIIHD